MENRYLWIPDVAGRIDQKSLQVQWSHFWNLFLWLELLKPICLRHMPTPATHGHRTVLCTPDEFGTMECWAKPMDVLAQLVVIVAGPNNWCSSSRRTQYHTRFSGTTLVLWQSLSSCIYWDECHVTGQELDTANFPVGPLWHPSTKHSGRPWVVAFSGRTA